MEEYYLVFLYLTRSLPAITCDSEHSGMGLPSIICEWTDKFIYRQKKQV